MKLYTAIANYIAAQGCTDVFGVLGDGNMFICDELNKIEGVNQYWARHEAAAISMAHGYARLAGTFGVATVTCGPGLTHAATPITAAVRGRVPMLVFVGEVPIKAPFHLQHFAQREFSELCGAKYLSLRDSQQVENVFDEAFRLVRDKGEVVVVGIPLDLQQEEMPENWAASQNRTGRAELAEAGDEQVGDLLSLIMSSERPVILFGRGAAKSGARSLAISLGGKIGALLTTTLPAKDIFIGEDFNVGICGGFTCTAARPLNRAGIAGGSPS